MAYYNNPVPQYFQPVQVPAPMVNQQQQQMTFVDGEKEANAFPVGPGQSVQLFDRNKNVFYIKSVDLSGMPQPIRIFPYYEQFPKKEPDTQSVDPKTDKEYVSKEEFAAFKNDIQKTIESAIQNAIKPQKKEYYQNKKEA